MKRAPHPLLALALLVVLTAGTPVPRVIPVDPGTCRDMCRVRTACAPCPASSGELPCRDSRGVDFQTCVTCQCGTGILVPDIGMPPPPTADTDYTALSRVLRPIVRPPASPPPKASV